MMTTIISLWSPNDKPARHGFTATGKTARSIDGTYWMCYQRECALEEAGGVLAALTGVDYASVDVCYIPEKVEGVKVE